MCHHSVTISPEPNRAFSCPVRHPSRPRTPHRCGREPTPTPPAPVAQLDRASAFLAESQVDIQLMTFYAFREDGKLFLARQIESESPKSPDDGVAPLKKRPLQEFVWAASASG